MSTRSVQMAEAPEQALQLLGTLAAHWQSVPSIRAWPVQLLTSRTSLQAAQALSYVLPVLLQQRSWRGTATVIAPRLVRALCRARHNTQMNNGILRTIAACILALKDSLPDDAWEHMPVVLTTMT